MQQTEQTGRSKLERAIWIALGFVFVGIGFVGYIVPVMPGTVFLIVALACFQRGSLRLESWLLDNRFVGPTLRNWRKYRAIKKSTKALAIGLIWISILLSCWRIDQTFEGGAYRVENVFGSPEFGFVLQERFVVILLLALAVGLTWYLMTRPTAKEGQ